MEVSLSLFFFFFFPFWSFWFYAHIFPTPLFHTALLGLTPRPQGGLNDLNPTVLIAGLFLILFTAMLYLMGRGSSKTKAADTSADKSAGGGGAGGAAGGGGSGGSRPSRHWGNDGDSVN